MKLILLGAGSTARELLRRLGEQWDVVIVDRAPERFERARGIRAFTEVVGDGSSRVTLERAGIAGADALVAATSDDAVNIEACRLAREAGILRCTAIVNEPEGYAAFREKEVPAISPDGLAARQLELALETRRVSSAAFADGKVEVIEFRVERDSPVRGQAVGALRADKWLVGAVLRQERFLVLQDDTVLETGDLVTVVGSGADFGDIVRTFTTGEARFPLDYGKRVAVALETEHDLNGTVSEAIHLARYSRASSLLLVHQDPERMRDEEAAERLRGLIERATEAASGVEVRHRVVEGGAARAVRRRHEAESIGVLVLPAPRGGGIGAWLAARRIVNLARSGRVPVLLSRGTHRYTHVLAPARRTPAGRAAAHAAIDLARPGGSDLTVLAMLDLVFTSGPEAIAEAHAALDWLKSEASMQGISVLGEIRHGNPVKSFIQDSAGKNLLILGVGRHSGGLLGTEIPGHILRQVKCSVLLVPALE